MSHWGLWLIFVAFVAYTLSSYEQLHNQTAGSLLMLSLGPQSSSLLSIIAMYLSGFTLTRAQRTHMDTIEQSLPAGPEVIVARWLAVATTVGLLAFFPLGVAFIAGPLNSFLSVSPIFMFEITLVILFSSGLIWMISMMGSNRLFYILPILLWIGSVFIPPLINDEKSMLLPGLSLMDFSRALPFDYTETWGRLTHKNYPQLFNIFYISAVSLLLGIMIHRQHRQRFFRASHGVLAFLTLSLISLLGV